jgi:hypothetical protein
VAGAVPLEPDWAGRLPEGALGRLTSDPVDDQAALDAWVVRETGGLLERMPVTVTVETLMVLATAITVRTSWTEPFLDVRRMVAAGPWAGRTLAGLDRSTDDLDTLAVATTPAGPVTVLTVEGSGEVDVCLLLGEEGRAAGEVLAAGLETLDGHHPVRRGAGLLGEPGPGVRVADDAWPAPRLLAEAVRFTVAARHDLLERAELFGLRTAAASGSFPGISRVPLPVAEARQEAMARFGATGFEASAVTAVMMATGFIQHPPVRSLAVSFDRPFGFAARSRTTGLVLVAGWVTDPEPWSAPAYS